MVISIGDIISVRYPDGKYIFGQVVSKRVNKIKHDISDTRLWHYEIYPLVPLVLPRAACSIRVHKDNVSNEFTDAEQSKLTIFKLSQGL